MPGPNQYPITSLPRTWAGDIRPNDFRDNIRFATIGTTGSQELLTTVPNVGARWQLVSAGFCGKDLLAQNDTNYLTFTITNKATGAGTAAMLATANTQTTATNPGAVTTGTGYNRAALPLSATAANLQANPGDVVAVGFTATGTLANTVTEPVIELRWRQIA